MIESEDITPRFFISLFLDIIVNTTKIEQKDAEPKKVIIGIILSKTLHLNFELIKCSSEISVFLIISIIKFKTSKSKLFKLYKKIF